MYYILFTPSGILYSIYEFLYVSINIIYYISISRHTFFNVPKF